ncbi:MAG TPA: Rossmann-like and DUF2520 domain-containing protein [Candidatus Angelobacter sp.]|nr:Rossmann-like and DUF2520 domain-containing protein [Candidatus Angelobacter sp.]
MPAKPKSRLPTISLVGSGNLAQVLGPALHAAGYRIETVAFRDNADSRRRATVLAKKLNAKPVPIADARPDAAVIWLCHTDDALAQTARLLARKPGWKGKLVFHSSGALAGDVLAPLRRAGAHLASVHPLMTFVPGTRPLLRNVPLAVEGDPRAVAGARQIAARLSAEFFRIRKQSKVLYHVLGSFASPLLVATLATAERVGQAAGLSRSQTRKMIAPIVEQTLRNYLDRSAAAAFSGPVKRGDIQTIRRHLRDLRKSPQLLKVYRALVSAALRELPAKNVKSLARLVD